MVGQAEHVTGMDRMIETMEVADDESTHPHEP